jgi:hypothetical protein
MHQGFENSHLRLLSANSNEMRTPDDYLLSLAHNGQVSAVGVRLDLHRRH